MPTVIDISDLNTMVNEAASPINPLKGRAVNIKAKNYTV